MFEILKNYLKFFSQKFIDLSHVIRKNSFVSRADFHGYEIISHFFFFVFCFAFFELLI